MKMQEIRDVAKNLDIKTSGKKKLDLIQTIHLAEGNFNCFASAIQGECVQMKCVSRNDCFTTARKLDS